MSAADVAEETKADVEAVKSVEDASYPTTASRELSHTKPSFAADADRGPGERAFYAFGKNVVGKRPWAVLLVVAALFAALTTGLFVASKTDTDLFGSLVLRPGSRVDRESKNTHRKLVEGYESGSEATNARATRGGKNMLTRKNMKQAIAFYRKKNVNDVSVTHGGVTYESKDMLLHSPGQSGLLQPVRFTTLDCFQEGAYDFFGDLVTLSDRLAPLVGLSDATLAPFGPPPRYTPYAWCLYQRLNVAYTPSTLVDPAQFGDCRQFVDEDLALAENPSLNDAYDFHQKYAFDYVSSAPSTFVSWGCRPPFRDEPAGRCNDAFTCCQISQIYSACATCEQFGDAACAQLPTGGVVPQWSLAICGQAFAPAFNNSNTWAPNPKFDPSYAQLPACAAFDFYPVSPLFGQTLQAPPTYPPSTDLGDCPERMAQGQESDYGGQAYVQSFMEEIVCVISGTNTCPALSGNDFEWKLLGANLATETEIFETASQKYKPCVMWDGGSALPTVSKELTLGDIKKVGGSEGTHAIQVVYASNGYEKVRDLINEQQGPGTTSKHSSKNARIKWLKKWGHRLAGRADGGSVKFGTYTSTDVTETVKEATIPELSLILIGYALILGYALLVFAVRTPGGCKEKAKSLLLAVGGIACVFFGASSGVGIGCYAGLKFNALSVQVLPFLLLGLGINDLFVFFYRYIEIAASDEIDRGAEDYAQQVVAGVISTAGYTVTITSVSNIVSFLIAEGIEMRLVAEFAHLSAAGLFGTWVGVFFGFTAMLAYHAPHVPPSQEALERSERAAAKAAHEERVKEGLSHDEDIDDPIADDPPRGACDAGVRRYSKAITSTPLKYLLVALGAATCVALAVPGLPKIELGMPLYAIFRDGSSPKTFWLTKDAYLPTQFFYMDTESSDWPNKHPLLGMGESDGYYSLFQQVASGKNMIDPLPTPPWYAVFVQWALPCGHWSFDDPAAPTWTMAEVQQACATNMWYSNLGGAAISNPRCQVTDPNIVPTGSGNCGPHTSKNVLSMAEFALAVDKKKAFDSGVSGLSSGTIPACSAWPVQLFLCPGPDGVPVQCFKDQFPSSLWNAIVNEGEVVLGVHPNYFYECLNEFLNADRTYDFLSVGWNCEDPEDPSERVACASVPRAPVAVGRRIYRGSDGTGDMSFTRARVWAKQLKTGTDWVDTIDSIRHRVNKFVSKTEVLACVEIEFWAPHSRNITHSLISTQVRAYPTGRLWKFYTQYRWMIDRMIRGLGLSLLAIWCIATCFFLFGMPEARGSWVARGWRAAWTAVLLCIGVAAITLCMVSLMGIANLYINCFTAVTIIMTVGIAMEFLAHTAFEHLRNAGKREDKAFHATRTYVGPIVDGAITSFLGFLSLAFARYEYIQLYYFQLYSIIIACGLFFGVVIFPGLLASAGEENDN